MKKLASSLYGIALVIAAFASGVAFGKLLAQGIVTLVNNWLGS